jgi:hypothetical protein
MHDTYPNIDHLLEWVRLRELARTQGYSGDPNIDNYRYCNVRRQDDRVTMFVTKWLHPYQEHPALIPNTIMARLFNNPETLSRIGFMETWDPNHVRRVVDDMKLQKLRVFNPAYIVSTNGRAMDKVDYLTSEVLPAAFSAGSLGDPELEHLWRNLTGLNGVGSFMAAQVVADLKFTHYWRNAPDWWTFVAPGPGSQRGMNRLRGLDAKAQTYNQKAFSMYIQPVRGIISTGAGISICSQDTQNCLCEFDKYMRLVSGEGKPKQTYKRKA